MSASGPEVEARATGHGGCGHRPRPAALCPRPPRANGPRAARRQPPPAARVCGKTRGRTEARRAADNVPMLGSGVKRATVLPCWAVSFADPKEKELRSYDPCSFCLCNFLVT